MDGVNAIDKQENVLSFNFRSMRHRSAAQCFGWLLSRDRAHTHDDIKTEEASVDFSHPVRHESCVEGQLQQLCLHSERFNVFTVEPTENNRSVYKTTVIIGTSCN